jgi:transcriptional regulator with PAS, ATPase and Fis domain
MQKTNVRITAATNVNIPKAIKENKFREDLYYRLNTVPIQVPALRERKEDIHLIFRKFASDFADKYKMPSIQLSPDARVLLEKYRWPGNVRQLKNVTEQISVIEENKAITSKVLLNYLPENSESSLPVLYSGDKEGLSERDILYKVLFDMRKDVTDLKQVVFEVLQSEKSTGKADINDKVYDRLYGEEDHLSQLEAKLQLEQFSNSSRNQFKKEEAKIADRNIIHKQEDDFEEKEEFQEVMEEEESLSISETEKKLIRKALLKHNGKRKYAAEDLGISERTLYRKIKEYDIEQ